MLRGYIYIIALGLVEALRLVVVLVGLYVSSYSSGVMHWWLMQSLVVIQTTVT